MFVFVSKSWKPHEVVICWADQSPAQSHAVTVSVLICQHSWSLQCLQSPPLASLSPDGGGRGARPVRLADLHGVVCHVLGRPALPLVLLDVGGLLHQGDNTFHWREREGNSLLVWVDISIVDGLHVQERTLQKYWQHTQGVFRVVVQNRYRVLTFSEERQEDVDTLLGLAKQEASLVPSLTAMAKEEANQGNFPHKNITNPVTEEAELASFNERSVAHERHGFKPSNL